MAILDETHVTRCVRRYIHTMCVIWECWRRQTITQIKGYPKILYILVLATLILYMIAIKNINNTLIHRVCQTEFVRYYLFSVFWEPPLSTVIPNKQIVICVICIKDHIVNISGFYCLYNELKTRFGCGVSSTDSYWPVSYTDTSFYARKAPYFWTIISH